MNFLQDHPRGATVGAIGVGILVIVALYLLSIVNQAPPSSDTPTTTTVELPAAAGQAANDQYPPPWRSISAGSLEQHDFAATLNLAAGQSLEQVFPYDVDSDGVSEAVVLVRGEGDGRPLDWYLFDVGDDMLLLFERRGIVQGEVAIDGPRIVESEGIYSARDDACCPASFKRTYYVWKDGGLVASSVVAQPAGAPSP